MGRLHKGARDQRRLLSEIAASVAGKTAKAGVYAAGEWKASTQEVHIRLGAITWGFPCEEIMFTRFFENFICHIRAMPWDNIAISRSTYLPEARNIIHEAFVEDHDTPWLAMLDSDVMPPPNYLTKLFADIKANPEIKIIGGWYKRKTGLQDPVVYSEVQGAWRQRAERGHGIEVVDGAGAGCWLMSREVAEAVGPRPYNMLEGGEDLVLCKKIRAAGYKLYIDWDVECAHVGMGVY